MSCSFGVGILRGHPLSVNAISAQDEKEHHQDGDKCDNADYYPCDSTAGEMG